MRDIKFRGKRIDNGEWVYGSYHWSKDGKHHYILNLEKFNERPHPNGVKSMGEMCLFKTEIHEVIPETVGQYTGLKDKNVKEIYEGDILNSKYKYFKDLKEIIGIVEEDKCNPCFVIHYKFNGNGHDCYEYDFIQCGLRTNEVIGNIYDNT